LTQLTSPEGQEALPIDLRNNACGSFEQACASPIGFSPLGL
jgi:hypothetical protein